MWFRYEAKASLPLPIGPLFDEKKVQLARRKALQDDVRPYPSVRALPLWLRSTLSILFGQYVKAAL